MRVGLLKVGFVCLCAFGLNSCAKDPGTFIGEQINKVRNDVNANVESAMESNRSLESGLQPELAAKIAELRQSKQFAEIEQLLDDRWAQLQKEGATQSGEAGTIMYELARDFRGKKENATAEQYYKSALEIYDGLEKPTLTDLHENSACSFSYCRFLAENGRQEEANKMEDRYKLLSKKAKEMEKSATSSAMQ